MTDCIFCKIIRGEIPSQKVYEDEDIFVFKDIQPKGPVHLLLIPKEHWATLNDVPKNKMDVIGKIFSKAQDLAKETGVAETGYRTLVNTNKHSGQVVFHIHFHLIGGKTLGPMA